jgi:hypothetical protein
MTRRAHATLHIAMALVIGTCLQVPSAAAQDWTDYRNQRFGFHLQYPASLFAVERTSEAGDGQVFAAREGDARLLVGALINDTGYSPASYQQYIARQSYGDYQITYRRSGSSWFVLSGEGKGRTFYEKVMFSCTGRLINSFAMIYPSDQRAVFDPVIERIENTFRPGSDCEHAGLPPAPRARADAPRRPARRIEDGERSAMADRIARARGRDVIVILRRTAPPYDTRIVRGYVSR